ncbi:hypothetical protein EVAR_64033_1 [Eumeta japonica]|uniref:Uncharacterized protein n=1 Tax=Eumeta variegata TaxID=151549 RepID=A0A4C1Z198_EUMVA|nr:hypothetical protein EVAR_64033_1 [Eumeta japonica]
MGLDRERIKDEQRRHPIYDGRMDHSVISQYIDARNHSTSGREEPRATAKLAGLESKVGPGQKLRTELGSKPSVGTGLEPKVSLGLESKTIPELRLISIDTKEEIKILRPGWFNYRH